MVCDLARILQLDEVLREQLCELLGDASLPRQLSANSLRRPFSSADVALTAAAAQRLLLVACHQVHPNCCCFLFVPPLFPNYLSVSWVVSTAREHCPSHIPPLITQLPDGYHYDSAGACLLDACGG